MTVNDIDNAIRRYEMSHPLEGPCLDCEAFGVLLSRSVEFKAWTATIQRCMMLEIADNRDLSEVAIISLKTGIQIGLELAKEVAHGPKVQ